MKVEGNIKKFKGRFHRFHLLPIEFFIVPIFFFLLLNEFFNSFYSHINLIFFFSFLFLFSFIKILLFSGFKNFSLLEHYENSGMLIYAGIATSIAFCVPLFLSPVLFFSIDYGFSIYFSRVHMVTGTSIWALSYVLLGYLIYKTKLEKKGVLSVGMFVYGPLLVTLAFGRFISICLLLPIVSLISLLMVIISIGWVNENFIEVPMS